MATTFDNWNYCW